MPNEAPEAKRKVVEDDIEMDGVNVEHMLPEDVVIGVGLQDVVVDEVELEEVEVAEVLVEGGLRWMLSMLTKCCLTMLMMLR